MKLDLEKLSALERRLNIEIPVEKVLETFERIYKKLQQQATIRGFRKGKAPLSTIRSMYRDTARRDVLDDLIQKSYIEALQKHELDPLNMPAIQIGEFDENTPFKFSAEFEVRPDVNLEQYTHLAVEKEKLEVNEERVAAVLKSLQDSRSELVDVLEDRTAQRGDFVVIDFEGFVNGAPLENASGQKMSLELGSKQMIPGFEEGVEGMKPGQTREVSLNFPTDYHVAQLAGQPVNFKLTLQKIQKKSLPELNEEFAKNYSKDSIEDLKKDIAEDLTRSETQRIDEDLKNRILKILVQRNPVDVPKSMLKEQKEVLIKDFKDRMKQQGMDQTAFEDYIQKWDADFTQTATFIIQSSFLVNAVATKENLRPTEDDVKAQIQEYATKTGIELARLQSFYSTEEQKSRLRFKITEDKVFKFLLGSAEVREVAKKDLKEVN